VGDRTHFRIRRYRLDSDQRRLQEYQENEAALTVDNAEISHIVNLFGCKNSTIIVKGKINAVTIGAYPEIDFENP
jgi:hypothetical protein